MFCEASLNFILFIDVRQKYFWFTILVVMFKNLGSTRLTDGRSFCVSSGDGLACSSSRTDAATGLSVCCRFASVLSEVNSLTLQMNRCWNFLCCTVEFTLGPWQIWSCLFWALLSRMSPFLSKLHFPWCSRPTCRQRLRRIRNGSWNAREIVHLWRIFMSLLNFLINSLVLWHIFHYFLIRKRAPLGLGV